MCLRPRGEQNFAVSDSIMQCLGAAFLKRNDAFKAKESFLIREIRDSGDAADVSDSSLNTDTHLLPFPQEFPSCLTPYLTNLKPSQIKAPRQ